MKSIEYLVKEHEEIINFTDRVEQECLKIMNDKVINEKFFRACIVFIREFADGVHHKKEEDILFKHMEENLGVAAEKLIRSGMLVEHQLGRSYCLGLEESLDSYISEPNEKDILQIITNAMSYVNLLRMHIEKENGVVYPFAERNLSDEIKEKVEKESDMVIITENALSDKKEELLSIIFA